MKKLNTLWGDDGHCIRLQQHKGPTVISDLLFSTSSKQAVTWSIEVKKVTEKLGNTRAAPDMQFVKPRHLSFERDFSIATSKNEPIPHQLERQVILCRRLGWRAVVLLHVIHPKGHGRPSKYLFDSCKLYDFWKSGHTVLPCEKFDEFHEPELADILFKGNSKWIKTTTKQNKTK
jgi:hypothetical protein